MEDDKTQVELEADMPPEGSGVTLRIVGGPESGKEFRLTKVETVLGRSRAAEIMVNDTMLSRAHAKVKLTEHGWEVEDLGSTNGTWVRGKRIKEPAELAMRTPVRIGQTLFELYGPQEDTVELDERLISYRVEPLSASKLEEVSEGKEGDDEALVRESRQLATIYRFQSLLSSNLSEKELFPKILELITEAVPADNAYLLTWSEKEQTMIPVAERNRFGPVKLVSDDYLSYSIINYVREKNESILSADPLHDERFKGEGMEGINVRSVMCVPMLGKNRLCGLIYVILTKPKRKYKEDELKLLNAIAHAAGMAIENMWLVENSLKSERMAAIGMTAASLSHYVKNVLNGLEGSISLLRLGIDNTDKEQMNEAWDILNKNHKRLSTLVLDLLNLAREDKLDIAAYNLGEIILETVDLVRQQCKEEKINLDLDEAIGKEPIEAAVDSRGIHRVILNLLNNAIDAVRERHHDSGEGRILIRVKSDPVKQTVEIMINDNGAGISAGKLDAIFDTFQSGKAEHGTGLGLAVSKRIVERHNGEIQVESDLESGSSFRVILPVTQDVNITRRFKVDKE